MNELNMKQEFQYRLQKSLAASGMTASELSEKSGISEANISNYINGKYVAKQDKCFLLAQALGVDPGWLMTGDEPRRMDPNCREFTIFVPSPNFVKMTKYMAQEDYENVVKAFEHAYERMKELGVSLDD